MAISQATNSNQPSSFSNLDDNTPITPARRWARKLRESFRDAPLASIGAIGFFLFIFLAIFGPFLTPYNPIANSISERIQPSSLAHLMGTDNFGRDILARIIYGARNMLALTGLATVIAVGLGLVVGLVIGYVGGLLDEIVSRLFDALLALPALLLSLLLIGSLGASRNTIIIAIIVLYVPIVARVIRSVVLDLKTKAYIDAAIVQGESRVWILFRELLPGVLPALAVEASLRFSYAIFLVASLSYLGIGVARPEPDWGLMVNEARDWYALAPWIVFWPAAAIVTLVVSVNLMSDGLRRIFSPN
jgi:peptide/nickel transport system permease protein